MPPFWPACAFYVSSLFQGPNQVLQVFDGDVLSLGKGTLYPLLYNLEAKKLIEGSWEETLNGRNRRYYSITGKGKAHLAKQKEELKELYTGLDMVFGGALSVA